MDCRAVLIFLCVLITQAACGPVRDRPVRETGAWIATVQLMREEIRSTLDHLNEPGLLPKNSCLSLNFTEVVGPEQQPLNAHHLSSFRCYMLKMSDLTPELSPQLHVVSQYTQDAERLTNGRTVSRNCSLPAFEQDMDSYVYVMCLLQVLDQKLSKAKF